MVHEELSGLLRIHGRGEWTNAFCCYLCDTVFPKWRPIEKSVAQRRKKLVLPLDS
jgi:hypothetical protein